MNIQSIFTSFLLAQLSTVLAQIFGPSCLTLPDVVVVKTNHNLSQCLLVVCQALMVIFQMYVWFRACVKKGSCISHCM